MRGVSLFLQELKTIMTNRKIMIPIIAILFIPIMYSGMLIWGFWDPYGHLERLPVAVVNQDQGATLNGEQLKIGDDLVENLKKKKQFSWEFVDEKEAEKGLKNRKYYLVIKIPENFSKHATTLRDEHPHKMELIYMPNESMNFLAAQIGNKAVEKLREDVADTLTETYAETMFQNIKKLAKGLESASEGAKKLHDGIDSAKQGAIKLKDGVDSAKAGTHELHSGALSAEHGAQEMYTHLKTMAEKSLVFKSGLQSASSGAERLSGGMNQLNAGFARLIEGQEKLFDGAEKARDGSQQLSDGLKQSLYGMKQMNEKTPQLANGAAQLRSGASNLSASLGQWAQGAEQTKMGAAQVSTGLEQLTARLDNMIAQTSDPQQKAALEELRASVGQLADGSKQVTNGISQLSENATALKEGADQLSSGAAQLHNGTIALSDGLKRLEAGQEQLTTGAEALADGQRELVQGLATFGEKMNEVKSGMTQLMNGSGQLSVGLHELASGSDKLQDGTNQLAAGSGQLASGMGKLTNGLGNLSHGMEQLSNGSDQLTEGMTTLDKGSNELAAKLNDGAKDANNVKANKDVYDMFAKPIKIKNEKLNEVPNYGTGIAPYFLSLGLFVGALLVSIVFPLREPAGTPKTGISWFISKFGVLVMISIIQSLIADTILLAGVGIEVQSIARFIVFTIITSLTFMALIQLLVTTLGDPGRFLAIIILILQLTTSAGTFPLELIPKVLQPIHSWLPMTYSVAGFRSVISSGDFAFMWKNAYTLLAFMIVFALGTITYFTIQHKRQFYKAVQDMSETPKAL
ncbi:YhgE/Pip domain-containing protein [Thermaerobacillus caldiproteolyticus]|uniref:Putative membrane protein n=1 Tax=Thermaerobacillus caldiproteolyticus TaxID=247480 RepID=A0A7V9Z678_9BACL|nr:YhgE/Pip domain-containing protein [Anoxybacillus caldiproteolyticus]MBA2874814.1 putative membrane protein [Anoxybacillus caldiproteolyticus]